MQNAYLHASYYSRNDMSSLIYYADPAQVLVVTDTLATSIGGAPAFFTSKASYVPHLRMIVAGTGFAGFAGEWVDHVNARMLVRGIEHLDDFAPDYLRSTWERWKLKGNMPAGATTTVYCFGISEETGHTVIFAYRSADDFESQRIETTSTVIGAKPDCALPREDEPDILQAVQRMMLEQRALQAAVPRAKRISIGGEAIAMHLTSDECRIFPFFRFNDFDEQMEQAMENMAAGLT